MILLSIIVPIYNAEKTLNRCINSVLNSPSFGFELILVNDGSTDSSKEICEKYRKRDFRVAYIEKENGGVSSARNKGLEYATGKYVVFLDADDIFIGDFFNTIVNNRDTDLISYKFKKCLNGVISEKAIWWESKTSSLSYNFLEKIIRSSMLDTVWAKRFKRDLIIANNLKFNESVSLGEDFLFICEYITHCSSVMVVEDIFYQYSMGDQGSLSSALTYKDFEIIQNVSKKVESILDNKIEGFRNSVALNERNYNWFYGKILSILQDHSSFYKKYKKLKSIRNSLEFKKVISGLYTAYEYKGNNLYDFKLQEMFVEGRIFKLLFKYYGSSIKRKILGNRTKK